VREDGRESFLRVLGLGPAASAREIKAAYRDLAKVWHPDRFAHDPRLQRKAQEQLKEINEAYRRLTSGDSAPPRARHDPHAAHTERTPRAAHAPRPDAAPRGERDAAHATAHERVATHTRRGVNRIALTAPAIAFCAAFALVTPRLLSTSRAPEKSDAATAAATAHDEAGGPSRPPADSDAEAAGAKGAHAERKNPSPTRQPSHEAAGSATAAQPARALATVTVSVDPTTGLRARPTCPNKSALTFPAGDEPAAYCDAAHDTATPRREAADDTRAGGGDDSRLKSFAGRLASPARKLFGGRHAPGEQASPGENNPHD
jgi:hypothetical protein